MKNIMESLQTFLYGFVGIWVLFLIIGLLVSSCSVVRTDISNHKYKKGMVYYYLPESLIKITSTVKVEVLYNASDSTLTDTNRIIEQKFVITTENIADTRELLVLNYKPNVLMSDYLKFQVSDKGLLESTTVKTDDRTAAIIAKLANAPEQILRIDVNAVRGSNKFVKIKEFSLDFVVKASDIFGKEKTIDWPILLANEFIEDEYKTLKGSFQLKILNQEKELRDIKSITNNSNDYVDGVLTRPILNTTLQISSNSVTGHLQNLEMLIGIVDHNRLINIPIKRTAFVKRENEVIIVEGLVKSNEITNPSSVEGFISIPIDVAKAIVSIPGQLVTFKYDNTNRKKELEAAKLLLETELLKNEKFQLTRE